MMEKTREGLMRIGLIGDTHGEVPSLEAAIVVCREDGCDTVVHCGEFIPTPCGHAPGPYVQ